MSKRQDADFSEDRLLDGRVRLLQPHDGYRAAIDPVLLAAAVPAGVRDRVLDIGCGGGAAALCLAARLPGCHVTGLEIQPDMAALAVRNAALSGLADHVSIITGDLGDGPPPGLPAGGFDHVMANPPYLKAGATSGMAADKRTAHEEGSADLAAWAGFALTMVRRKGTVSFIHRADRLDDLLAALRDGGTTHSGVGDIRLFPLWPKADGRPAKRVLVRARKGVASPLRLCAGLVLHAPDDAYSAAAEAVLRGGAALDLD